MPSDRHLVLIGVMGSGKTKVGHRVAVELERELVDTDALIESEAGRSVAEIFAEEGQDAFRSIERRVVQQALAATEPAVISTGGGAVLDAESRQLMTDRGVVVWLDPPVHSIAHRLGVDPTRPLLAGAPIAERLTEIRAERADLYESTAQVTVTVDADVETVVAAVLDALHRLEAA